jgi:hypothetical protein
MDRRAAVVLNDQRTHAVVAEQQRRTHADQTAADDQDRYFDFLAGWFPDRSRTGASGRLVHEAILRAPVTDGNARAFAGSV